VSKHKKIYLIYCSVINLYKIGISVNPKKRIKQLQTGTPYELSLLETYDTIYASKIEKIFHNTLKSKKAAENFNFDFKLLEGEWFSLSLEDVWGFSDSCSRIEKMIINLKKEGNPFV